MGGCDDEDMPYVNKQKQDEELKNKLNESSHWSDQDSTVNNAKWAKEGQNQLRKVAENHQDQDHNWNVSQNGNKEDFPEHHSGRTTGKPGADQVSPNRNDPWSRSGRVQEDPNEPLLINTLESTEEKDKEREEHGKEKEKKSEEEEDASGDTRGEKVAQNNESLRERAALLGKMPASSSPTWTGRQVMESPAGLHRLRITRLMALQMVNSA